MRERSSKDYGGNNACTPDDRMYILPSCGPAANCHLQTWILDHHSSRNVYRETVNHVDTAPEAQKLYMGLTQHYNFHACHLFM